MDTKYCILYKSTKCLKQKYSHQTQATNQNFIIQIKHKTSIQKYYFKKLSIIQFITMVKIVDNYTLTDYLGKGEYGKVYKAFNIDTKIDVAVKMIKLDKFDEVSKLAELTKNQIQTIKLLDDNINIIKFVEMIKTNHFIYLVYEYCEGGTLEDLIKRKGKLSQKQALMIFRQIICAFKSLHQHHILHRDVKSNNIFFKSNHLKLADFGFCKRLRSSDDFTQTSLGSPLYMAPQILNGDVYGSKADIWSCGIVLYEMLYGYCPYGHCNIKQLLEMYNSQKCVIPMNSDKNAISPATELMLRRMLEKDQFRRISWQDFFYQYDITAQGTINRRQKDFEYDLMKLMKKNSTLTNAKKRKQNITLKFDWSKITDKNSSVHSQQLNESSQSNQFELGDLLQLKRKVKQFQSEHTKMVEITLIIESMLDCQKQFQYSNTILYFLIHNLCMTLQAVIPKLDNYIANNKDILNNNPNQANTLNKLLVVFNNESKSITARANSIKVTLMQCQELNKEIFKYPSKIITRKYLKQFLKNYEENSSESTTFDHNGSKQDTLFLLRVVWAIALCAQSCASPTEKNSSQKSRTKQRQLKQLLSIKSETTKFEISILLNKLLVFLGV